MKVDEVQTAWVDLRKYDAGTRSGQSRFDRGRPGWYVLLWWLVQGVVFPLTLHNLDGVRCAVLRLFGAGIGKGVKIRPTARFTYPWKIEIGDWSWIGDDTVLYSLDRISIGSHCVVSQKSYLCTGSHDIADRAFGLLTAPIIIEDGAWIASDCFVGPGVNIGANTVIGARSNVIKSIPSGQVAWGNPCRVQYPREMKS